MDKLTDKQKKELKRIIIALVMFILLMITEHLILPHLSISGGPESAPQMPNIIAGAAIDILYIAAYLIVGHDVLRKCLLGIKNKQLFDESFLMTVATFGAFGCGELEEAVAVMLFYQIGEFFQGYAVGRSRGAITELMSIAPDYANRETADGSTEVIDPDDIQVGDVLVIKPGEKIPTDAVVIEGHGFINTAALTGESVPRSVGEGDQVISGCINGDDLLRVEALKEYDDSTVVQILEMVETAASKKSKTENFITRFAHYYTPAVVIAAVVLAVVPPLISGRFTEVFGTWLLRACTFLVISCPCALVISVPLAFFGGIGAASKKGVLVKGSNYLEMMAVLDTVVTDKTGTLTEGVFRVSSTLAAPGHDEADVIKYAAAVEAGSTHPIGAAIIAACSDPFPGSAVKDNVNHAGKGAEASVDGDRIAVGNSKLFDELGIEIPAESKASGEAGGTHCYVAKNGIYIGTVTVADMPKAEAAQAVKEMRAEGVRRIVMLTGDSKETAAETAAAVGISDYRAELLPQDKVRAAEELLAELGGEDEKANRSRRLAFIGDGINDAPVLSRADVGIAMGSLGSDAAIEAADIVIMDDKLSRIPAVIRIARKTIGISKANIVFALAVKFVCLALGAVGLANMWTAVFADVGVAVICILNSMRMLSE